MKVICVTLEDFLNGTAGCGEDNLINVGDILTVEELKTATSTMGIRFPCYKFVEISPWVYDVRNFAILPGLTEADREEIIEQAGDSILA